MLYYYEVIRGLYKGLGLRVFRPLPYYGVIKGVYGGLGLRVFRAPTTLYGYKRFL